MSARILVVDDNPLNVKLLMARLGREYYSVTSAASGMEALDKMRAAPPDLVLLDVMMPEMSGFDVCIQIRKDPKIRHIPVIMVTALSDVQDRVYGLEAGADDFLSKPINDLVLLARVRSSLRLKMLMDEWRLRQQTGLSLGLNENDDTADLIQTPKPRVLLLSDNTQENKIICEALPYDIDIVNTPDDYLPLTAKNNYDLMMLNLYNSAGDVLPLCPALRSQENTRHTPILLLAESSDVDLVTKGLDLGASDCVLRPLEVSELTARVRTQIKHKRSYDRLKSNYSASLSLALTDPLTGAFNRRYLESHLPTLWERCRGLNHPFCLLMVDADHFKKINDSYGHTAGDNVLKEIVRRISQNVRVHDFVARMGGEEFLVALPETDLETATLIAGRLRSKIADHLFEIDKASFSATVSIGVAEMRPETNETIAQAIDRVDKALYVAKAEGRNKVVLADLHPSPMTS